jgi:hypothetical protein
MKTDSESFMEAPQDVAGECPIWVGLQQARPCWYVEGRPDFPQPWDSCGDRGLAEVQHEQVRCIWVESTPACVEGRL